VAQPRGGKLCLNRTIRTLNRTVRALRAEDEGAFHAPEKLPNGM
jgi:hypothetical protein